MKIRLISRVMCLMTLTIAAGIGARVAKGYDRGDCNRMFGSANVVKVQPFKIDTNNVDFGDEPHFGGAPHGNAVLCWSVDGRVAVKGKLYSDNLRDPQTATVHIRFRRTNGELTLPYKSPELLTQGGWVANRETALVSPLGNFNEVDVRLWKFIADTGLQPNNPVMVKKRVLKR